ncbi:MAG: putative glycolipid-binding domain-containing protein [Ktedonobacterales bacterium]
MAERERALIWRRVDTDGLEYCALAHSDAGGWTLGGTVVVTFGGRPAEASYEVVCDEQWQTKIAVVSLTMAGQQRTLRLAVDDERRWWADGQELPELQGCVDVDLGVTPATNTLPIRRLGLDTGASALVTAAWVRFPSLEVSPLVQGYTRLDAEHYRYESGEDLEQGGEPAFTAELLVDDAGLVLEYEGLWQRVATEDVAEE